MKVKHLVNWLIKFYIGYWNFGDNQSINWLFSESGQHYWLAADKSFNFAFCHFI